MSCNSLMCQRFGEFKIFLKGNQCFFWGMFLKHTWMVELLFLFLMLNVGKYTIPYMDPMGI